MRYKNVIVPSHPRSGSHWVMRLISVNFFDGGDYLKHYGGHPFGEETRSLLYFKPKQAVIYTYRNLEDTIKSIYNMRHRFGLDQDDYEKFKITPMHIMYNPKLKVDAVRDTINQTMNVKQVDALLGRRKETVGQFIEAHKVSWRIHEVRHNFMRVNYDMLTNDFQVTMLNIARLLGSNKKQFVDEDKRVGWHEKSDANWKKPGNKSS